MSLTRRNFLKLIGAGAATLGIGAKLAPPIPSPAPAAVPTSKNWDFAVLFDQVRCIGCKLCQITCKQVNNLPADPNVVSLSATTLTLIDFRNISPTPTKPLLKPVKRQCMHCEEPACVSVCPVGALYKRDNGVVAYAAEKCIGCRYCMTACPFDVPKYNWNSANPKINKCAAQCLDDGMRATPACVQVCPVQALQYGKRDQLLAIARDRIQQNPNKYVNHIYGEREVGGTSWLYLSGVPYEQLGFRTDLGELPMPHYTWNVMEKVPWVLGTLLVGLSSIAWWTHRTESPKLATAPASAPGK